MFSFIKRRMNDNRIPIKMIIPVDINSHFKQRSDEDMPVLFIALVDCKNKEQTIVALDPDAASKLAEELDHSPMKMFIRTNMKEKDIMFS